MDITTGTRRIVVSTVLLVIAGAVFAAMMLASVPTSSATAAQPLAMTSDMPGTDHGARAMPAASPSPTMARAAGRAQK